MLGSTLPKSLQSEILELCTREGFEIKRKDKTYTVETAGKEFPLTHPFAIYAKLFRDETNPELKYSYMKRMHDMLWPHQTPTWNFWTERRFRTYCEGYNYVTYAGGAGTGKDQPLWCKIKTPSGWTTMGDVKVGDIICTTTGSTQTVLALHPQGVKPIYKLTFSDGSETYAGLNHLWQVQSKKQRNRNQNKYHIYTTQDLLTNIKHNLSVPPIKATIGIENEKLPIHPWLLGYFIANGCSRGGSAKITSGNKEALKKCQILWPNSSFAPSQIKTNHKTLTLYNFISLLHIFPEISNKLSVEKSIPSIYLHSSIENRKQLLAGLLDGDGCVDGCGCSVSFSNHTLSLQTQELARSLGYIVSISGPKKAGYTKNKTYIPCSYSYRLFISIPPKLPSPFSLSTKVPSTKITTFHRRITKIEYAGEEETKCITVSGENNLYITDDFIPTHNSYDAAKIAIIDFFSDPTARAVIVASTTLESLSSRIFGYVIRLLHEIAVPLPYHFRRGMPPKILYDENDKIHGIFALAAKQGDDDKAIRDIIGRHPKKGMLIILDESTDMPVALLKSFPNLESGGIQFQVMAIGNSNSKFDLHGALSTPKEGDWKSINPKEANRWETTQKNGICLFFSCYESPAILEDEEEKRLILSQFFITQKQIEEKKKLYGENSDSFYRFVLGFWRSDASDDVVLSRTFLDEFNVRKNAEWSGLKNLMVVAGLDPAFSTGGDACILRLGILGQDITGKVLLDFRKDELLFRIKLSAVAEKSAELQIADEVIRILNQYSCSIGNMAVDATGQGRAIAEVIRLRANAVATPIKIWSTKIGSTQQKSFDVVVKSSLDLWTDIRDFIQTDQIRGLDDTTIAQLTTRLIEVPRGGVTGKRTLESKQNYKTRMGAISPSLAHSPDEADSVALALQAAKIKYGFTPGQVIKVGQDRSFEMEKWYAAMSAKEELERHDYYPTCDFSSGLEGFLESSVFAKR